jgi:hypothetical protein
LDKKNILVLSLPAFVMHTSLSVAETKGEIILYQSNTSLQMEVVLLNETVWLSQAQMAELFQTSRSNITMHISHIFKEGELEKKVVCQDFLHNTPHGAITGKTKTTTLRLYNLDVIISVGYRVKSPIGTKFRQWALGVIKEYVLKGYAVHHRIQTLENRVTETEKKLDFFISSALPPLQGVFYDGEVFDAYIFVANLVKSAKKSIILIDNYLDESVLLLLSKRKKGVTATIYTEKLNKTIQLDIQKHTTQYPKIEIKSCKKNHDHFLIIDKEVYHIGASIKDLGKKLFAFSKL